MLSRIRAAGFDICATSNVVLVTAQYTARDVHRTTKIAQQVKAAKLSACQTRQTYICQRLLYPGFVNVAPLQFREKLTRVHLDQPRGCAKIANVAVAKIAGKISRQQRSIVFASRAR
jgi:hypothetical protein